MLVLDLAGQGVLLDADRERGEGDSVETAHLRGEIRVDDLGVLDGGADLEGEERRELALVDLGDELEPQALRAVVGDPAEPARRRDDDQRRREGEAQEPRVDRVHRAPQEIEGDLEGQRHHVEHGADHEGDQEDGAHDEETASIRTPPQGPAPSLRGALRLLHGEEGAEERSLAARTEGVERELPSPERNGRDASMGMKRIATSRDTSRDDTTVTAWSPKI